MIFLFFTEGCHIQRTKRKPGKLFTSSNFNIELIIDNIFLSYKFTEIKGPNKFNETLLKEKIATEWKKSKHLLHLVMCLDILQASIQDICENIVLLDRVQYLKELGIDGDIVKVTENSQSPRCFALVATKQ